MPLGAGGCRSTGKLPRLSEGRCPTGWPWGIRRTAWPWRWSPRAARAHADVVSVLTPAEILIAARRLAGARPHLAAVAGIVHQEDLWQLCRDELTRPPRSSKVRKATWETPQRGLEITADTRAPGHRE